MGRRSGYMFLYIQVRQNAGQISDLSRQCAFQTRWLRQKEKFIRTAFLKSVIEGCTNCGRYAHCWGEGKRAGNRFDRDLASQRELLFALARGLQVAT